MTRQTGCSLAVLLNGTQPRPVQMYVSHLWSEDVEELVETFRTASEWLQFGDNTSMFFCAFCMYQTGDELGDCGPTPKVQMHDECVLETVLRSSSVKNCQP